MCTTRGGELGLAKGMYSEQRWPFLLFVFVSGVSGMGFMQKNAQFRLANVPS